MAFTLLPSAPWPNPAGTKGSVSRLTTMDIRQEISAAMLARPGTSHRRRKTARNYKLSSILPRVLVLDLGFHLEGPQPGGAARGECSSNYGCASAAHIPTSTDAK